MALAGPPRSSQAQAGVQLNVQQDLKKIPRKHPKAFVAFLVTSAVVAGMSGAAYAFEWIENAGIRQQDEMVQGDIAKQHPLFRVDVRVTNEGSYAGRHMDYESKSADVTMNCCAYLAETITITGAKDGDVGWGKLDVCSPVTMQVFYPDGAQTQIRTFNVCTKKDEAYTFSLRAELPQHGYGTYVVEVSMQNMEVKGTLGSWDFVDWEQGDLVEDVFKFDLKKDGLWFR